MEKENIFFEKSSPKKLKREYTSQKDLLKIIQEIMMKNGGMKQEDMSSITNQHLNIAYANNSVAQKLDVFIPEGKGPFPAVLLIHGGAFRVGDKSFDYTLAKNLVKNGFVAIPINYRLSGEAKFPTPVHDCKAALRYVRANADKFNINSEKIGAWGASAGGYFSSILATSGDNEYMDGTVGDYTGVSTKIQAAIDWYGPIDFSKMIPQSKVLGFPSDYDVENESLFIDVDANDSNNLEVVRKANPLTYLDKNTPPFWVEVGNQDPLIPYLQSENFAEELIKVLGTEKVDFTILDNEGHGGKQFDSEENLNKAISFLEKHLK